MADDFSFWMGIAERVVAVVFLGVFAVILCALAIYVCTLPVEECWQAPRMRLFRLGGVTTLRQTLNYPCTLCLDSMEAGEKVRTLSCGHTFHCGGIVKCENDIDQLLSWGPRTPCPVCRKAPLPVLPWKRPPPLSPSSSDLEEALLLRSHRLDEALSEASSSAPESSLAQSPPTSRQDSEEALLPPAHDETLPEASSSAPAPPLAQSSPTSRQDSEEVLPLAVDDETQPDASSSQ